VFDETFVMVFAKKMQRLTPKIISFVYQN